MANTFQLIASSTVGAGGSSAIDFSSIPSTYTDLCLKISARVDASGGASSFNINMAINGVSTNRTWRLLEGYDGTNIWSNNGTTARLAVVGGSSTTGSTFNNVEIYIANYASAANKSISSDFVSEQNSTTVNSLGFYAGLWSQTTAINQLTLSSTSGNFVQYTTAYLYGVKNA
jgi:hypothetical protein